MKLFKWSRLVFIKLIFNLTTSGLKLAKSFFFFFFFFFFFANDDVSTPDFYIRLCCIIRNIYISCCISMSIWLRKKLSCFHMIISIIYLAYQSNYKTNFHIFSIFRFLSPIFLYYCPSSHSISSFTTLVHTKYNIFCIIKVFCYLWLCCCIYY